MQQYALILEATGLLEDVRCLDAGCGFGDLTRLFAHFGARAEGCDIVEKIINQLHRDYPHITWFTADIAEGLPESLHKSFKVVVATDVLQSVNPIAGIRNLWEVVEPGGRLIGFLPNADCPIVKRTAERFDNQYCSLSILNLVAGINDLPGKGTHFWRGAYFLEDQTLFPYNTSPWYTTPMTIEPTPNRLQFVVHRSLVAV